MYIQAAEPFNKMLIYSQGMKLLVAALKHLGICPSVQVNVNKEDHCQVNVNKDVKLD